MTGCYFRCCSNLNKVLVFGEGVTAMPCNHYFEAAGNETVVFLGNMTNVSATSNWPWSTKYIYFAKSHNYGNDNTPIYVVLSNADISRMKNAALKYDRDHQIVIRMTKKNYTCIMHYLDSLESKELSVFKNIGYEALNSHVANVDGLIICIS